MDSLVNGKVYKVAVIGGGASGLLTLLELLSGKDAISPSDVVLLERNDRVGKKILATGNGQCNLSNVNVSESNYHGDGELIKGFFKNFNQINLIEYLKNFGIYTVSDETGRIYPVSRQASAVSDQLRSLISTLNPEIITNFRVDGISYNGGIFSVDSGNNTVHAEKVVFACGGRAGEGFGTDGTAYKLLEKFGHKTGALYPSIVKIKTEREKIKGLKNLKERATVSILSGGKTVKEFTGDVLFTDYGVSGNAVYSLSAYIGDDTPVIKIKFLPDISDEELEKILEKRKNLPYINEHGVFVGLINKKIGCVIEKTAKSKSVKDLIYAVRNFDLKVLGTAGFDQAQTTKGGFSKGVNSLTYESEYQKGLFIVGEALDVDGDCGGYNLTFAFVSGIAAARSIKSKK